MTKTVRTLIFSHLAAFGVGFIVGKRMDADELAVYREANESLVQKLRRKAGTVALSLVALTALIGVFRLGSGRKNTIEE